jgi:hypothetical protein
MDQHLDFAAPGGRFDLLASGQKRSRAGFQTQAVKRRLSKRSFDALPEIVGNPNLAGLERPNEGALQLSLCLRDLQRRPVHSDPGAAPGGFRANIRRDRTIGSERQADKIVPGGVAAAQDALALRLVLSVWR